MKSVRTLVAATAIILGASFLAPATAFAGGAPDLGDVPVDPVATFAGDTATLTGTYTCTYPGTGTIGFELLIGGSGQTGPASFSAECDGFVHPWRASTRGEGLRPGPVTFNGYLEVCDAEGACPWNLFMEQVALRPVP